MQQGFGGSKKNIKGESVHNRAVRYFLAVHKCAPVLVIRADMGRWGEDGKAVWLACEIG